MLYNLRTSRRRIRFGDPEIRAEGGAGVATWLEAIERASGASRADVIRFSAFGMYLTIAGAIDLPAEWWPQAPTPG